MAAKVADLFSVKGKSVLITGGGAGPLSFLSFIRLYSYTFIEVVFVFLFGATHTLLFTVEPTSCPVS